jgi:hypothetical protein
MWEQPSEEGRILAGRYELLTPLGAGGMGRVWLARDEVLRRDVAVKEVILPEGLTHDEREELCVRTMREAQAAAQLNHPNVVQIYDVVEEQERPWIVMEYLKARSLFQVIKSDGPLPPRRVAEIGLAVLSALQAAHAVGIIHRDVKPGNVLLTDDGRVALTDFGLATFTGSEGDVTRPGLILGSVQYVAPERARDGTSSRESDLWALGATLYAAVEGRSPYARDSSMATLTALATTGPDPFERAGPLKTVLNGLLRRNPKSRMDAIEVERYLRRIVNRDKGRGAAVSHRPERAAATPPPVRPEPATVTLQPREVTPRTVSEREDLPLPRPPRSHRGGVLLTAAVAALALVVGAAVATLALVHKPAAVGAPSPSATPARVSACDRVPFPPASSTAATPPVVATPLGPRPSGGADRYALLDGWLDYSDPSGFRVGVPPNFASAPARGSMVCWSAGAAVAWVDQWTQPGLDPVAYLRQADATASLPAYKKISLGRVDCRSAEVCAEWEFTFQQPAATPGLAATPGIAATPAAPMHVRVRIDRVATGQVYQLGWLDSEYDWSVDEPRLIALLLSFRPAWPDA